MKDQQHLMPRATGMPSCGAQHDASQDLSPAIDLAPPLERDSGQGPDSLKVSFTGVVLVCGDCEERGSGPRKFNSKDVRKQLKDSLRPAKGRLRVAVTGCLGPCPKKAMTVAVVAGGKVLARELCRASQADSVAREALALVAPSTLPEG